MDQEVRRWLLELARSSVAAAADNAPSPRPSAAGLSTAQRALLEDPHGAFVSLHDARGAVRGCVGTTAAQRALAEVVTDMARAAAIRDPRFPPVQPEEVPELEVEVSVLEPPEAVRSLAEVQIGRHGLLVVGRGRRGLLLPQVASEQGWDPVTFAEETCKKAGLPSSAYHDGDVELYRFRAEVFNEGESSPSA